jgi:hypothetical protein
MARRVYGTDVDDPSVATVLDNCAHALTASGDIVEAERLHRESLAMARRLYGADADHPHTAAMLVSTAVMLESRGDAGGGAEAARLRRESQHMSRRLRGDMRRYAASGGASQCFERCVRVCACVDVGVCVCGSHCVVSLVSAAVVRCLSRHDVLASPAVHFVRRRDTCRCVPCRVAVAVMASHRCSEWYAGVCVVCSRCDAVAYTAPARDALLHVTACCIVSWCVAGPCRVSLWRGVCHVVV